MKDFAPISLFSVAPQVLVVNPKFPAKTVAEFIAYVKAQKGKLVYAGGGGPGSSSNLIMSIVPQARRARNVQRELSRHCRRR